MSRLPAGTKLPTLSLWQPWASLTANGREYETRDYSPGSKGLRVGIIAIHATKRPVGKDLQCKPFAQDVCDEIADALRDRDWKQNVPRGALVATAVLAGAFQCGTEYITSRGIRMVRVVDRWGTHANVDEIQIDSVGSFLPGRWAWWITGTRLIDPPIDAPGRNLVPWHWVTNVALDVSN